MKHYIRLMRPPMFMLPTVCVFASYAVGSSSSINYDVLIPILSAVFGAAAILTFNDYFDAEADKLAKK